MAATNYTRNSGVVGMCMIDRGLSLCVPVKQQLQSNTLKNWESYRSVPCTEYRPGNILSLWQQIIWRLCTMFAIYGCPMQTNGIVLNKFWGNRLAVPGIVTRETCPIAKHNKSKLHFTNILINKKPYWLSCLNISISLRLIHQYAIHKNHSFIWLCKLLSCKFVQCWPGLWCLMANL